MKKYSNINWNNIAGKGYKGILNSNDYMVGIKGSKNSKKSFDAIYIAALKEMLENPYENPLFLKKRQKNHDKTVLGIQSAMRAINLDYPNTFGSEWEFSSANSNKPYVRNKKTKQRVLFGAWDGTNVDNLSGMSGAGKFTSKIYIDEPINSTDGNDDKDIDNIVDKRAIMTAISSVLTRIEKSWYSLPKHLQPQSKITIALNPWDDNYWMMEWFTKNDHDKHPEYKKSMDYTNIDIPKGVNVRKYILKNVKGYFYQRVMYNPENENDKRTMLLVSTNLACNDKISENSWYEEYYENLMLKKTDNKYFLVKALGYIGAKPDGIINKDNITHNNLPSEFFIPRAIGIDGGKRDDFAVYLIGVDKREAPNCKTLHIQSGIYHWQFKERKDTGELLDEIVKWLEKWKKDYSLKPRVAERRIPIIIDTRDFQLADVLKRTLRQFDIPDLDLIFNVGTATFKNKKGWLISQRVSFWALITGNEFDKRLNININKDNYRSDKEIIALEKFEQDLVKMTKKREKDTNYKNDHSLNAVEYAIYPIKKYHINNL